MDYMEAKELQKKRYETIVMLRLILSQVKGVDGMHVLIPNCAIDSFRFVLEQTIDILENKNLEVENNEC